MKRITLFITAVLSTIGINKLYAQNQADAMKAWQDYMTPGAVHKMLATSDGTWNEDITMWMAPGAPPSKTTATTENKMIMGGRYQESTTTGTFNGMPFEGKSILGYDNAKKTFYSSWFDNMGTGIIQMQGTWDDATKTINFTGAEVDPATGKDLSIRQTITFIDSNTQMMNMYMTQNGKEYKNMEMKLTRK